MTKWILLLIAFGAALTATVRVNYLFDRITDEINKVDPKDRIPVFGGSKHDLYRDLGRHKRLFAESDLRRRFYRWIGMSHQVCQPFVSSRQESWLRSGTCSCGAARLTAVRRRGRPERIERLPERVVRAGSRRTWTTRGTWSATTSIRDFILSEFERHEAHLVRAVASARRGPASAGTDHKHNISSRSGSLWHNVYACQPRHQRPTPSPM